jgi:3D (Asp-Asp-Asp) domain-containing protein
MLMIMSYYSNFWVHGNSVKPEITGNQVHQRVNNIDWTSEFGLPQGWGITFRGGKGKNNWYHFALSHVISLQQMQNLPNIPSVLERVFVAADIGEGATVDIVDVYFSNNRNEVHRFKTAQIGDHTINPLSFPEDLSNLDLEIKTAIGISVHVTFERESNITFIGAGVNLKQS